MGYKNKYLNWWITTRNRMSVGRSQLYFLYDIIKFGALGEFIGWRFEASAGYGIVAGILAQIIYYVVGWLWDRLGGYHAMAEFNNNRNPTILKMKEKLGIEPDEHK